MLDPEDGHQFTENEEFQVQRPVNMEELETKRPLDRIRNEDGLTWGTLKNYWTDFGRFLLYARQRKDWRTGGWLTNDVKNCLMAK